MSDVRENAATFTSETSPRVRKKFATQMDERLLERLRAHAKSEGRQLQAVLEDAVEAYLKDKQGYVMRPEVKAAYERSLKKYDKVYRRLSQ